MDFRNSTQLDSDTLRSLFLRHTAPYRHDKLIVRVRYGRGADFSGRCFYSDGRILINLGRHNQYPYSLATHVAKAQSSRTHWWRDVYRLTVSDAYQLALFIYLHELYHFLVRAAGRVTKRKEAMCDRFATRVLVDCYGCPLCERDGRPAPRETWDFKDLDQFVAGAPREPRLAPAARKAIAASVRDTEGTGQPPMRPKQLELGF
jgi:hypothetical protein